MKQNYHHGDLRRALLQTAAEVIEEQGPAGLSLRDLSRRAGVSHAAPAHHFGDKAGLLTAFAAEGYDLLAAELTEQWSETHSSVEQGVAYVRFALRHRAHFEVMFRPDLYHPAEAALTTARNRAAQALYLGISDPPPAGSARDVSQPGELREAGMASWSIAHGFATLWVSGSLPELPGSPDEVARRVLGHLTPPT